MLNRLMNKLGSVKLRTSTLIPIIQYQRKHPRTRPVKIPLERYAYIFFLSFGFWREKIEENFTTRKQIKF